jgi:predicted solute-binding protein
MPTRHLAPAFATLSTEDRTLAIGDAALRTGVSTVILEKDFWVT